MNTLFRVIASNEDASYSVPIVAPSLTEDDVRSIVDVGDLAISVQNQGRSHSRASPPNFIQEYLEEARDWLVQGSYL